MTQAKFDPQRRLFGAFVVAFFALPGLVFSAALTALKFKVAFTCEDHVINRCGDSCSRALLDVWSTVGVLGVELPITVFSGSFFAVHLALAGALLLAPRLFGAATRGVHLALGWAGLLASAALLVYSIARFGELCMLCAVLYVAVLGVFQGAWLMGEGGPLRLRGGGRVGWLVLCVALAFGSALTGVQFRVYRRAAAAADHEIPLLECWRQADGSWPESRLVRPAAPVGKLPRALVALFVDLACAHCRAEVAMWRALLEEPEFRGVVELRVYHLPLSAAGENNGAREAAMALNCLAAAAPAAAPGWALDAADALFALQEGKSPYFDKTSLAKVAGRFGVTELALGGCMDRRDAKGRIERDIMFAQRHGIVGPPAALLGVARAGRIESHVIPGGRARGTIAGFLRQALKEETP
ncbi:MAG: hypothetical protein IPK80_04070 [Nannocystis sp.]|nr:hypothetical protein [Nannocystis sp.]